MFLKIGQNWPLFSVFSIFSVSQFCAAGSRKKIRSHHGARARQAVTAALGCMAGLAAERIDSLRFTLTVWAAVPTAVLAFTGLHSTRLPCCRGFYSVSQSLSGRSSCVLTPDCSEQAPCSRRSPDALWLCSVCRCQLNSEFRRAQYTERNLRKASSSFKCIASLPVAISPPHCFSSHWLQCLPLN